MSFDSDYLDLAIGLAVVFFLASLVVSGLNEAVAWGFRRRAKFLWAWLYSLVDDSQGLGWKPTDRRPTAPGASTTSEAQTPPRAPDVTSRLLSALAPVSPMDRKNQKTTIKHIPPSSLAQAFLEVFSDLGRKTLATNLPALLSADVNERRGGAVALGTLLARPPDRPASAVQGVFQQFADNRASDDEDVKAGAVNELVTAIGGLSGAQRETGLSEALNNFVEPAAADQQKDAESVISALAQVFPEVLVRERLQASIQFLDGTPLAPTLKRLWDTSTGEMDKFREQFEQWLQGELDRLGGFYKRSIRWITLGFVVAVTLVLNIDAIGLTQSLWRNPEGRTALVSYAQQLGAAGADSSSATTVPSTTQPQPDGQTPAPPAPAESGLAAVRIACEAENAPTTTSVPSADNPTATVDPEAAAKTFTEISNCVTDALNSLSGLGVVDTSLVVDPGKWWDTWSTWGWSWWRHLIGLVATGAALFLGAPFWFDIVKRLTGMRRGVVGNT